jgi:membrane protein YdbS with pleckstrin-like domain
MSHDEVLLEAKFNPKLKLYWFLNGALLLLVTVIGIPLLPLWVFGLGQFISKRRYEHLRAHLGKRTLYLRSGYLFKTEKHVPLDRIQDLTLREGPVLRALGLVSLTVETAGQSQQGTPDASLAGLLAAPAFRDAVLEQRDALSRRGSSPELEAPSSPAPGLPEGADAQALLADIRDVLVRIEGKLDGER